MTTPSKADVLHVAGEPFAYLYYDLYSGLKVAQTSPPPEEAFPVYANSQLLAMYAAGAEGMRERAAKACDASEDTGDGRGIEQDVFVWNKATKYCARHVRALPITPTNTEGEQ